MGPLGELFLSPERRAGRRREVVLRARRDLQEKVQKTGTIDAREFAGRTAYEGPTALARELGAEEAIVAPGDYNTATRLRKPLN